MFKRAATDVLVARAGRTVFGLVLIAGALGAVAVAVPSLDPLWSHPASSASAVVIAASWPIALVLAWLARVGARRVAHRWQQDELAQAGLIAPAIGLSLLVPSTVQLPVALCIAHGDYDSWMRLCIVLVGFAHVVLAIMFAVRCRAIARGRRPISVGEIYASVVLAGCVPGMVFVLPPVLVAVTGLALLPLLRMPERIVAREQAALADAPIVPFAIAATVARA